MQCVNRNIGEYQTLLHRSGLSPYELDGEIAYAMEKYGRYPRLDEISHVDSTKAIEKDLDIKIDKELHPTSKILQQTKTQSISDAQLVLNDTYRDKEIIVKDLGDTSYMEVRNRPTKDNLKNPQDVVKHTGTIIPDITYFSNAIDKLQSIYGLNFKEITNKTLATKEWLDKVPNGQQSSAFIYNGDIYLNVDNLNSDAPVHEMLHIFFGSIKYSIPELYNQLVGLSEKIPNYNDEVLKYKGRIKSDINEEILVTQFSKFVSGKESILDNLDDSIIREIKYNVQRTLDSVIFGRESVDKLQINGIMNSSLKNLSILLDSTRFDGKEALVSRQLNNRKAELIKNGELTEICI